MLACLGFACSNFAKKNKRLLAVFSISEIDSQRCHATQCSSRSITFFVWRVCKSGDSRLRIICNFSIRCCLVRNQIMEGDGLLKKVTLNDGHEMPMFGLGVSYLPRQGRIFTCRQMCSPDRIPHDRYSGVLWVSCIKPSQLTWVQRTPARLKKHPQATG